MLGNNVQRESKLERIRSEEKNHKNIDNRNENNEAYKHNWAAQRPKVLTL